MHEECDAACKAVATVRVTFPSRKVLYFCPRHYEAAMPRINDVFLRVEVTEHGWLKKTAVLV